MALVNVMNIIPGLLVYRILENVLSCVFSELRSFLIPVPYIRDLVGWGERPWPRGASWNSVRWGGPASDSREQFLEAAPAKRAKIVEDFLGSFLDNFTVSGATVGNLERYAKTAGDLLIIRPRVLGNKEGYILDLLAGKSGKPRKYPIELVEATRQDDMFEITLPPGYVPDDLPQPVKVDCEYASYQSEVKVTGNVLHYKRTYEVKDISVPTEKLAQVKDFFRQVAADERASAVLRRAN